MKTFIIILFISSLINANIANYDAGVNFFEQRDKEALGLKANSNYINQAINEFSIASKNAKNELDAGIYLLRCYYFKGKFVAIDDESKKKIFSNGKQLGEKLIILYPESPAAYYWYLVNLGSWAEVYGILSAAREGVANIMRNYSKKIIELDSEYSDGGGYFMLGAVHLKSPYIPFLLTWPSKKKSLEYLSLAYDTGDATPSQTVYLARSLFSNGKKDKAKSLLNFLLNKKISKSNKLEDLEQHQIAKELLLDWK